MISDLIRQFAFSGFPWNLWGTDWTIPGTLGNIFIQPAAIFGVHGLTLLTVLLAGLPLFKRRGLLVLVAALLVWAGFGIWRLQTPVTPTGITVALVQPDFPVPGSYDRAALISRWQRLLAMSQGRAASRRRHRGLAGRLQPLAAGQRPGGPRAAGRGHRNNADSRRLAARGRPQRFPQFPGRHRRARASAWRSTINGSWCLSASICRTGFR